MLKNARVVLALIIATSLFLMSLIVPSGVSHAATGINQQLNFQGRLLNAQGAVVADGYYNIQFKIYQDGDGQTVGNTTGSPAGSLKWTESHLNAAGKGVQVKNGFMSVQLGSVTAFGSSIDWNQDTLWLSMNVGNTNGTCTPFTACGGDGEMIPMKRLSASPYAVNSGLLGGKTSEQFIQLAQGVQTDASVNTPSIFINKTNTGNLLQLQSSGSDVFTVTNSGDITLGNNSNHSISIGASVANTLGRNLSLIAGAGGSGTGSTGGTMLIQGGAGGGTNGNGGDVVINAGAKTGTGTDGSVSIGTANTTAINLNQDTRVAAGKTIAFVGGATSTRPASPTEGMVYFDTDTKQLMTYSNGKWKADSKDAVFVAASNSSQADKDAADYVADGNTAAAADGDQVQINLALAAASGKQVVLLGGTYTIDASISILSNTTLAGIGDASTITIPNGINTSFSAISGTNQNNVTIRDLKLDGNKANQSGASIAMTAINLFNSGSGSGTTAVKGALLTGLTIQNWYSNGFTSGAIFISSGANSIISDNSILNNHTGSGSGINLGTVSNMIISNNIIQGNGSTEGIRTSTASNTTINDNNLLDSIDISGTNNTITGNIAPYIRVTGSSSLVSDNRVSTTTMSNGILLIGSNHTVVGNSISGATFYGIRFLTAHTNTVTGNAIANTGGNGNNNAIYLDDSDGNFITNNTVTDTSATTTNFAINILNSTSDNNYLADNTLGTGSINNVGTGTIYGGQVNSSGNYVIQPTGTIDLMKNTTVTSGTLTVGTSSVKGNVVINDGTNNTATITVGDLSGNYTYTIPVTTANDTFCLQALANCVSSGVTTVGVYSTTNTDPNGATISGNAIIFQDASATAPGMVGTGNQTFAGNKTFNGTVNTMSQYQIGGNNVLSSSALTFTAAGANTIQASNNQSLSILGGNATTTNANGSSLNISGGAGNGTGVKGLVNVGPSAQTAVTNATCSANCTITQSNVDNYGTIIISASVSDIIITLPPPTNTTQGRTVYVTTASGSQDFTLRTNTGGDLIDVAMRQNTTSTMIWNGTAWTPGGASNATTLQATYNNGSNPATTPEIKLDTIRGTIDIQDADTSIGTDILNIRGSNASGLGTVLFGVSNEGRVTIQGTTDQTSAFRVLGSNGDYLFNINSSNSYVISNATRAPGNDISNPGFETGGTLTSGEAGWFGPPTGAINNDAANAKAGNHVLAVTASSTNSDYFAGKYYEVQAGEGLYFEGWIKGSSGANGNAGIQISWYDKDKALIGTATGFPNNPGTSYVLRTVTGVAPANTHYARVSATVRSNASTGTYYFDNFYMKRNLENADMLFKNSTDSATAFRIQSAGAAQTLFTANTSNNTVKIGDSIGSGANTTLLVLDSATADPTTLTGLNGGIFYRSDNNSLKAVIGGAVVDICTTAVTCAGYSASAGSAIALQTTSPGTAQTGNFNITGTGILTQLQTQDNTSGSTQNLTIRTGNAVSGNSGNLVIDTGTASGGTSGTIRIGHSGVTTTMPGNLVIQGSNTLSLGSSGSAAGSILFRSGAAGSNTVTISAPTSNPTASYNLILPSALGGAGECLKSDAAGNTYFQGCGVGVNFNLQDAYNNSGTPANITLADSKDLTITAADTSLTDPSVLFNLQCSGTCDPTGSGNGAWDSNGRFSVQHAGVNAFSVLPNGGNVLVGDDNTSSTNLKLFQLDSYNVSSEGNDGSGNPAIGCSSTVNQGALYYNTSMNSMRGCLNGTWVDVSNPDTLGLLTFGIVPSSGNQPYDLPGLVTTNFSGPCKVSWASTTSVSIQPCTAYSNGRRINVQATTLSTNSATGNNTNLTTTARWGHICLDEVTGVAKFTNTAGTSNPLANLPTFDAETPILCLADILSSSTTNGVIDDIYDVRTFTSAMKEAINTSTAVQLGMLADSSTTGGLVPAVSGSAKLYGAVVATNGSTSGGAPNAIVTTVGPAWIKGVPGGVNSNQGQAGTFVITSTTNGYAYTNSSIPNNSFYYSAGNTRTSFNTTCTSAANCNSSFYVNLIVR